MFSLCFPHSSTQAKHSKCGWDSTRTWSWRISTTEASSTTWSARCRKTNTERDTFFSATVQHGITIVNSSNGVLTEECRPRIIQSLSTFGAKCHLLRGEKYLSSLLRMLLVLWVTKQTGWNTYEVWIFSYSMQGRMKLDLKTLYFFSPPPDVLQYFIFLRWNTTFWKMDYNSVALIDT